MNLITAYLEYRAETEPPTIYHRWSMISGIGALLGRRYYLPFGDGNIYPNLYCMLVGGVGTRKSTAIKGAMRLLKNVGYHNFSARKTSKERFLVDLEGLTDGETGETSFLGDGDRVTDDNLFGGSSTLNLADIKEVLIAADEFNEFSIGDKLDFYSLLGDLWDWDDPVDPYTYKIKGSKRGGVSIWQPTVSILGGNTPENFARAFPPEIIGQGFMSRLLVIHGETSGRKYHMPPVPDSDATEALVAGLKQLYTNDYGRTSVPSGSSTDKLLSQIYSEWAPITDHRFRNYGTRRYTQLLKLCLIHSAAMLRDTIDEEVVIYSNTVLAAAEVNMPRALGEFGKNKDSDVINNILTTIRESNRGVKDKDLWQQFKRDITSHGQLAQILSNLNQADAIQFIPGKGWLGKEIRKVEVKFVDWSLLTQEERDMIL